MLKYCKVQILKQGICHYKTNFLKSDIKMIKIIMGIILKADKIKLIEYNRIIRL